MSVFKLEAEIGLNSDAFKKGLAAAGESMKKMAKVSAAAVGAASVSASKLVKDSITAFADYEQYIGGIETLFGNSAESLIKNSEKAFATAGMDVNQYMETSIQSAASLINSLGGDQQKAAELMDVSITDMADNVNKMGTSLEGVQNAYRGFSRGNFQMLDNLALGFAGTKEGMQELLDKAQEISGIQYDISSYSDIVQAIHVVQTEMGITGTTAKEAAKTISGSIGAAKAAWKNLTVEIAKDNGDVSEAFKLFGNSVGNVFENILPRAEQALDGVGDLIVEAAPQISKSIGQLVPKLVPSVLKTGVSIVGAVGKGLVQAAPELLTATSDIMKTIFNSFMGADLGVFDWIKDDASRVVEAVKDTFKNIDIKALKNSFGNIGIAVGNIFERVGDGAAWLTENVIGPFTEWVANSNVLDGIAAGLELIGDAADFLKEPAKDVWENFLQPLCEASGGALDLAAKGLRSIADEFEGVEWSGFWDDIGNGEFFANWERGWNGIKEWFSNNGNDIDEFFGASGFGAKWNEFWQGVGAEAQETQEMWTSCFKIVGYYFNEFVDTWKAGAKAITDAIDSVKDKYNEFKELWGVGADVIKENSQKTVGGMAFSYLKGKLPGFAEGGRVTQPTIAMIGEREPETIIPDSKRGEFGTTNYNTFNFNIDGTGKNAEEIADEVIEAFSSKFSLLGIKQQRAVGGAGW